MIQELESYGLIYFKYQNKLQIRGLNKLSRDSANQFRKWIRRYKQRILQDAPDFVDEDKETGEVIVYDPDLGERIFFDPPLAGPGVDPERWDKILNG